MPWFGRKRGAEVEEVEDTTSEPAGAGADLVSDASTLQPVVEKVGESDRARIAAALEALAAEGVDVEDLASIGAGLDAAYRAWDSAPEDARPDHAAIVERYALAIGEHLDRNTDLDWQVVTDVFGTDLALTEGFKGAFVVVPHNLVAGRWMRGETGWVPAVVGHLVRRRTRR
jgi:hypothetical protein